MKSTLALLWLSGAGCIAAQQVTTVPRLVRISNTFRPANGQSAAPVEGVTLSIYRDEREGAPLWQETQNVSVDSDGRYSVMLGATLNDGLPVELFTSGETRWLGVRFNRPGEVEQPRTLLTSVPYALRASDAETLGGLPASAFLRDPSVSSSPGVTAAASATLTPNGPKPRVTSGAAGYLGMFTDATDLGNSSLYQYGTRIGLNTTLPLDYMHVAFNDGSGAFTGYAVQNLNAAGFSGMLFYDQNGALAQFQGFGNTTHEYRINNIASNGIINFMIGGSSKLVVANSGNVGIGAGVGIFPQSALDVGGDINFTGALRYQRAALVTLPLGAGSTCCNLGVGLTSLQANTAGVHNTALGNFAMYANTFGSYNTAVGDSALGSMTEGGFNTAVGFAAMDGATSGNDNTAVGYMSGASGNFNTSVGFQTLSGNSGANNTAVGADALGANVSGGGNTAVGAAALLANDSGGGNTAVGQDALQYNMTGSNNIAVGYQAGYSVSAGNSNNIHIGSQGSSGDSGTIRIGTLGTQTSFYLAGVNGVTTTNSAVPVLIDTTNGQLGVMSSSRRYKEDIQDMGDASSGLMQLRPVTFRYQKPFADGAKPLQYGLIAEEVAEVYPDLVARSADGQVETVKYQVLDSMLLNEVQRQQAEIQDLRQEIGELRALISNSTGGSK
jgi:Chaperone of endosialidase